MKMMERFLSMLLVVSMLLGLACFGVVPRVSAASAGDYIAASYASSFRVRADKVVGLKEVPDASASDKYTVPAGTMLTVTKLHRNTSDTHWYRVLFYKQELYVDALSVTVVEHLTGDVDVSGLLTPAALGKGQGFPLEGKVTSERNRLGTITASVHRCSNLTEAPVISSSDEASYYSYDLKNSGVDVGMIYSDLAAGSYTHVLSVEAIGYYVTKNGELDGMTTDVVLESKPLIVTTANVNNPVVAKGIDVSVHQGTINWAATAPEIDFAILRIGWETTLDTQFKNNAAGCNANGVPFGVYIYSYAESEAEAIAEANFVINALKDYDVDLPIYFDIEDPVHTVLGASTIQKIVRAFCDTIRDAGYEPGLYTFLSWFNTYFGGSYYNSLPKWVAQVDVSTCSYAKGLTMWQYSWTGRFSGISGDVDCNYLFGEFPGENSDSSYLSKCTYYPSNAIATTIDQAEVRQYPSTDYTSLETLSAGTEVRVVGIYKNAYGNCWYQVDLDGVTGYIYHDLLQIKELRYDDVSVIGPAMDDMALKTGYYLKGKLYSKYNDMQKVHARIYSGEDVTGSPVLQSSDTAGGKEYVLNYSKVCDDLCFSDLAAGYYTYEISADVTNYYVQDGTLVSKTKNVPIWTKGFTVGGITPVPPASMVCAHTLVTDPGYPASCTEDGLTDGAHCSKCGMVVTAPAPIPATGHSYSSQVIPATCQDFAKLKYTCGNCQHTYTIYANEAENWSDTRPEGVRDDQLEIRTQYRYSDFGTVVSDQPTMAGFTQMGKTWQKTGSGSVQYAQSWPAGFETSHAIYGQYNKTKVTASETATTKTVIDSDKVTSYIYYHWCQGSYTLGPINRGTSPVKADPYLTFHAFVADVSTMDPTTLTPASDGSVTYPRADACTDSHWWYYIPVHTQSYSSYTAEFTYEGWKEWSEWSDDLVTATATRKVETRIVYRPKAELGDHTYVDGVCSLCGAEEPDAVCKHPIHDQKGVCGNCGETVGHSYTGGVCDICGKAEPVPKISPNYFSVSFEGEVLMNIYFKVTDMEGVAPSDMGLLTWTTPQADATIATAQNVIPGAMTDGNFFMVRTEGIPAKKLGDLVYFKIYARMSDGSYVYSKMLSGSPKNYALTQVNKDMTNGSAQDKALQKLCVAMLNYGSAAQTTFSYKPYSLMNATLTQSQRDQIRGYDPSMVAGLPTVNASKVAKLKGNGGFSKFYPSISFDGAFSINFYMVPGYPVEGGLKLYYWDPETYDAVSQLALSNATKVIVMENGGSGSTYWGALNGIAAKEIDRPGFFAGVYTSGGITYSTGVICYSLGRYCQTTAANMDHETRALAAETAVYGYYAKQYFALM